MSITLVSILAVVVVVVVVAVVVATAVETVGVGLDELTPPTGFVFGAELPAGQEGKL